MNTPDAVPAASVVSEHPNYITVTYGMSGYFAVELWWNPGGFYEPWTTGSGRYKDRADAVIEAKQLAEEEGLEYRE